MVSEWGRPLLISAYVCLCFAGAPTNPLCYSSLKQNYIRHQDVSEDFYRAMAHSHSLTHMYIQNATFLSRFLGFEEFPCLCELCTYCQADVASGYKPSLGAHGVCGFVKENKEGSFLLKIHSDLQSLWPIVRGKLAACWISSILSTLTKPISSIQTFINPSNVHMTLEINAVMLYANLND